MTFPKAENIAEVIHNLKKLKDAKQNFWKASATLERFDKLNGLSEQKLWSDGVQPTIDIVKNRFEKFQIYGCIQNYGTGRWKSKKSIDTMIDGSYSPENDGLAIDEIIKELETVKQNIPKAGNSEKPAGKKRGILRRIPYWIYILTAFLAALLTSLHYLGCLEPIKAFISKILWPK